MPYRGEKAEIEPGNLRDQAEAAVWVIKLDHAPLTELERAAFHKWLEAPRNSKALRQVHDLLTMMYELPPEKLAQLRDRLDRPPGYRLTAILSFLLTASAFGRYVAPVVADMQYEHAAAAFAGQRWRARWIVIRCYLLVIPNWLYAFFAGKVVELLRKGR